MDDTTKELLSNLSDLADGARTDLDLDEWETITAAMDLIDRLTKTRTLEECREVLNEREYLYEERGGREEGEWHATMLNPRVLFNGFDVLTLWEANAIVRAYVLDDAQQAKEAARG